MDTPQPIYDNREIYWVIEHLLNGDFEHFKGCDTKQEALEIAQNTFEMGEWRIIRIETYIAEFLEEHE